MTRPSKATAPRSSPTDKQDQGRPTPWQEKKKSSQEKSINKIKEKESYPEPYNNSGGKSETIKITTQSKPASPKSIMNKSKIYSTSPQGYSTAAGTLPTASL